MNNNFNNYPQPPQGQPPYGGYNGGAPRRNGSPLVWVIVALLVVIIVMLVAFITCNRESTGTVLDNNPAAAGQPSKTVVDTVKVVTQVEEVPAEPVVVERPGYDGSYTLSGKVGPARSNISLKISKSGVISGTERYAKGGGAAIYLSGSCTDNGTIHIDETYQGDWCGSFDGKIIKNGSRVTFKGSFLNSRGSGYNFNLSGTRN